MHVWAITHVRGMRMYTEPGTPCGLHGIAKIHAHTFKGLGLGCPSDITLGNFRPVNEADAVIIQWF